MGDRAAFPIHRHGGECEVKAVLAAKTYRRVVSFGAGRC
jgi:hypothetical protein